MRIAAEGDFLDVVGSQVARLMGRSLPARADLAVSFAVGGDDGSASGAVAWFVALGSELTLVPTLFAAVFGAARLDLQPRTAWLRAHLESGRGHELCALDFA